MRQIKISQKITNRATPAVEKYLSDISKIPMLTLEQEIAVVQKRNMYPENSALYNDAIHQLVNANLRFVVSVAKQYQNQGLDLLELINEGNIGLITAAKRFDETRGFKFISYAVWRVRQSILSAIAEQGRIVRLPQNKVGNLNKIKNIINAFEQEWEREPSSEELSELADMPIHDIEGLMMLQSRHTSLDAPMSDESDSYTMGDLIASTQKDIFAGFDNESELIESVRIALNNANISYRDKELLFAYFGIEGKNIDDFMKQYDLTRERVRQLKERIIKKLQKHNGKFAQIIKGEILTNTDKNLFAPIPKVMKLDHIGGKKNSTTHTTTSYIKKETLGVLQSKKDDENYSIGNPKKIAEVKQDTNKVTILSDSDIEVSDNKTAQYNMTGRYIGIEPEKYEEIGSRISTLLQKDFLRELHLDASLVSAEKKYCIKTIFSNFKKYRQKNSSLNLTPKDIIHFTHRHLELVMGEQQLLTIIEEFLDSIPVLKSL